ncbi:hypothetical protein AciX9_2306 [Granulicella tundricola MP5ACTX9]|uniref:Uncharacterized protein n=1 Tax=Granulicella tundricola (strain ATCC BAA-1859 / DSM 23138 / MP5ACTX9) TaxID=1198114 RepID=E8X3R5_GRATM|nr:hypothetical protein AciX9_2306 [Granulicella tundricola MP5ACTX9]
MSERSKALTGQLSDHTDLVPAGQYGSREMMKITLAKEDLAAQARFSILIAP